MHPSRNSPKSTRRRGCYPSCGGDLISLHARPLDTAPRHMLVSRMLVSHQAMLELCTTKPSRSLGVSAWPLGQGRRARKRAALPSSHNDLEGQSCSLQACRSMRVECSQSRLLPGFLSGVDVRNAALGCNKSDIHTPKHYPLLLCCATTILTKRRPAGAASGLAADQGRPRRSTEIGPVSASSSPLGRCLRNSKRARRCGQ